MINWWISCIQSLFFFPNPTKVSKSITDSTVFVSKEEVYKNVGESFVVIVIVTQHLFCIWFGFITSVNPHMKINTNTFNSSTFYLLDLSKGNNINTRTSIYIEKGTPLAPDHGLNNL